MVSIVHYTIKAIIRLVREAAPLISVATPGPRTPVIPQGRGRAHLRDLMVETPGGKTPESSKPEMGESSAPVGAVIPVASKGDKVALPADVSSKRNLIPAEECSTISDLDIPSDQISELFSDTLSWTGKWSDSEEEQLCDLEEDQILPVPAASVKIKLSASKADICVSLNPLRRIAGQDGSLKSL